MRPIKRAIILCWIMLVACFAIKLFGGNWFEVVCTNEHFSNLCYFVQNNKVAFEIFSFVLYVFPTILIVLSFSLIPNPSKIQIKIIIIVLILVWATRFISMSIKSTIEPIVLIVFPIILNYIGNKERGFKKVFCSTWYYGIVGSAIALCFQVISLITRNAGIKIISKDVLTTFIMLIDYYIMLILYYLYVKLKKGTEKNG